MPVEIFCCYARKDRQLLNELKAHLMPLQRQRLITLRADTDINAGTEWEQEINRYLNTAQIILLLVSPDFMVSDYCYSIEMKRALERQKRKEAHVIPIILRPVHWQDILGNIQALPTDAKPVISSSWHSPDDAFFDVAEGIRKVVEEISKQPTPQKLRSSSQSKGTQSDRTIPQATNGQDRNPDLEVLKIQFHEAMLNIYKEARKIGYHATEFFHMVNENGGVETAHLLIAKDPTTGFTKLWDKKRLDLSAEALLLKPEFAPLFDEDERQKARQRLADYGYKALEDN